MSTWIRSQNKEQLTDTNDIYTRLIKDHKYQLTTGRGIILGEYSSKDKAIKVLDMIQNHINGFITTKDESEKDFYCEVFEMPQDDEVEL